MIDLLLINPHEKAYDTLLAFKAQGLTCKAVITPGYVKEADFVGQEDRTRLKEVTAVTTALAFGKNGQNIVEELNSAGKIILGNLSTPARFQKRLQDYFNYDTQVKTGTWLFETVSFKGRHVLCYSKFYNEAYGWKFIDRSKQDLPFFSGRIEEVFEYLDAMGVLNGPTQVYIDNESKFSIRFCPGIQNSEKLQKHFSHIWPEVLAQEKKDTKLAMSAFYSWADRFGSAKRFSLSA